MTTNKFLLLIAIILLVIVATLSVVLEYDWLDALAATAIALYMAREIAP